MSKQFVAWLATRKSTVVTCEKYQCVFKNFVCLEMGDKHAKLDVSLKKHVEVRISCFSSYGFSCQRLGRCVWNMTGFSAVVHEKRLASACLYVPVDKARRLTNKIWPGFGGVPLFQAKTFCRDDRIAIRARFPLDKVFGGTVEHPIPKGNVGRTLNSLREAVTKLETEIRWSIFPFSAEVDVAVIIFP